jgi:putrescine transport system substrate-binding protein
MQRRTFLAAAAAFAASVPSLPVAGAEEKRLHIYNWSDYIAPDTVANFTKKTGIAVSYDVYDSNEVLEAKLLAGRSGYDVVVPSASPFLARQITAGAYLPLDKAKLPNLGNLDPHMLALAANADPGNRYGVPYLWSVTGLGCNAALLDRALAPDTPRDSLALVFDPEIAARLDRIGIEIIDTPQEVVPAALTWLGIGHGSRDRADLDRAASLLERVRPYIRRFHSSQYINDLAAGDIGLALGYSGDVIQARNRAREAGSPVEIAFRVPREGSMMAIDMLAIPKDAPHPDNAHRFIDYILHPDVIARITETVSYPNPNLRAIALVDPEIRDDPGIYPPPEVMQRLYLDEPAPRAYERLRTRVWNRIKTGC